MSGPQRKDDEHTNAGKLPEDKLMAYLEGTLTGDELREVELLLADESMESDALEGLQGLNTADAREIRDSLNRQLQQALNKKKRRKRRGIMNQQWSWMAVAMILMLAIVCFAVLWLIKH